MLIGAMNTPARDPIEEIDWIGSHNFGFVDLTLEPPGADPDDVDAAAIRLALAEYGLGVVTHATWYLPLASPLAGLRAAALDECRRVLRAAYRIGAKMMTVHYDVVSPHRSRFFAPERSLEWHVETLAPLCDMAADLGVALVLENTGGAEICRAMVPILEQIPLLGLHLDAGHAALGPEPDSWDEYLRLLGSRLMHVHLSENDGGSDQHLPFLSSRRSTIDWREHVRSLKALGYDGTITLEVFSRDPQYLLLSRDLLQQWWDEE